FIWTNYSYIWNISSFVIFLLQYGVLSYFSIKKCISLDFHCLFKEVYSAKKYFLCNNLTYFLTTSILS
ncbi:MAG: hypothetical protein ACJAV8_000409, partial [Polaribacter sp.]